MSAKNILARANPTLALEWHPTKNERQLADLNGLARIYDPGRIRYVKEIRK